MKKLLPTTEADYKTSEYREAYAKHILSNIENPILNWDVSVGQFKVDALFPGKDDFSDIYLRNSEENVVGYRLLRDKICDLFGNKKNKIMELGQTIRIWFDYLPLGENTGKINASLI